jgi:hypothetical protein
MDPNEPKYGQLHILYSAEATKNGLKTNQINGIWPN